jgi:hypothetical protein
LPCKVWTRQTVASLFSSRRIRPGQSDFGGILLPQTWQEYGVLKRRDWIASRCEVWLSAFKEILKSGSGPELATLRTVKQLAIASTALRFCF